MIPLGPVVARARVRAPRATVWNHLVDPALREAWWPEIELGTGLGGAVAEQWSEGEGDDAVSRDASGEIDVWVEGHAVGFRWREAGDEGSTAVLVTLRSQGVDTGVTVTETGFDALPAAAERSAASLEGWQTLLADLVAAVDAAGSDALVLPAPPAEPANAAAGSAGSGAVAGAAGAAAAVSAAGEGAGDATASAEDEAPADGADPAPAGGADPAAAEAAPEAAGEDAAAFEDAVKFDDTAEIALPVAETAADRADSPQSAGADDVAAEVDAVAEEAEEVAAVDVDVDVDVEGAGDEAAGAHDTVEISAEAIEAAREGSPPQMVEPSDAERSEAETADSGPADAVESDAVESDAQAVDAVDAGEGAASAEPDDSAEASSDAEADAAESQSRDPEPDDSDSDGSRRDRAKDDGDSPTGDPDFDALIRGEL